MIYNRLLLAFSGLIAASTPALADENAAGLAKPWQLGFQEAATPVMARLIWLHNDFLLYIITVIAVFVLLLTLFICVRFSRRVHPKPTGRVHNTPLEIIWTVIPILILVAIAIPSIRAHYYMARVAKPELTVKVLGHQWYWSYEYPDQGDISFDSYMIKDEDLKPGQVRLLEVDNRLVVPVDTVVRVQLTASDVIHSWAVPAFGVKKDAVPGRLNETWFKAEKEGLYYGQCSELCGVGHGFMPIAVQVVSKDEFTKWVQQKQKESGAGAASTGNATTSPKVQKAVAQPKALESGVPNVGNTETNPQPDRSADLPAKKKAAAKHPGTATELLEKSKNTDE